MLALALASMAALADPAAIERIPVLNGGELVTVFQDGAQGRVPVVSYLKDTLGDSDPANDRIRHIWVLAHKRQSIPRHILAAVPYFYTGLPSSPPPAGRVPRPMLNFANPQDSTVSGLGQQLAQVLVLDTLGTPFRAASRSYRLNRSQHRELRIAEAASSLLHVNDPEVGQVRSRLLLSTRLLGGLVSSRNLELVHEKEHIRLEEMRGHNWELLRQQAEKNHLDFEPLRIGGTDQAHALLSISRRDLLEHKGPRKFDGRFLGISDPWNRATLARDPGPGDRIPLALYSLDHPRVPYLLVDLRNSQAPRRREMFRRAAQDTAVGVFGFSRFTSLPYFGATWAWDFIQNRRGAASNRAWRIRCYAELRQKLNSDTNLDPVLRERLKRRTSLLSVNPLDDRSSIDAVIARVQYDSLRAFAVSPKGLARKLERGRQEEAALLFRTPRRRAAIELARWTTLGLYRKRVRTSTAMLAALDRARRIETHRDRVERALAQGPLVPEVRNLDTLRASLRELIILNPQDPALQELAAKIAKETRGAAAVSADASALP